ncbi:MAG: sensor domain-containing diguanylate cyclase [Syntrophales bacterium]|nr:sensor domain-containing diguanylate cyclase [Syntrophales bacterium]
MTDALRNNPEPVEDLFTVKRRIREREQSVGESRATEEALWESEAKFRFFLENMADVAVMVDMDLRITYTSPSVERILGFTPEERKNQQIEKQMPPKSFQLILKTVAEELEREKAGDADPDRSRTLVLDYYRKDGSIITLETSVQGVRDSEGALTGFYGLSRDISERKRMEEKLAKSEEKFRKAFYTSPDAVNINRLEDGMYVSINQGFTNILGYTERDIIGKTSIEYNIWGNIEDRQKLVAGLKKDGEVSNLEAAFRTKNGDIRYGLMSASLIDLDGVSHILNITRDITDRKRMEDALKKSEKKYRELSTVDKLTRLNNFRQFYLQLQTETDRSNRYEQPLTLLILDLDDFKVFNDAYGHIEGDKVLRRIGRVIKRCLRKTDFAYRYGGEEFTIILPMTTSVDGAVIAEKIRTEVKNETFSPLSGQNVHVTMSIGFAQYRPQEDLKVFVHRVDQLMYQGKKQGKDRVCYES